MSGAGQCFILVSHKQPFFRKLSLRNLANFAVGVRDWLGCPASLGTSRHGPGTFLGNMTSMTFRGVLEIVCLVVQLELRWER